MNSDHRISFSEIELESLTRLAAENNCFDSTGKTSGQPSWRALIRRICHGEIELVNLAAWAKEERAKQKQTIQTTVLNLKEPKPKREKKPWKGFWQFRAKWWKPISSGESKMWAQYAVDDSGMSLEELIAGGLELCDDGRWLSCPDRWKGWLARASDDDNYTTRPHLPIEEMLPDAQEMWRRKLAETPEPTPPPRDLQQEKLAAEAEERKEKEATEAFFENLKEIVSEKPQ